MYYLAELNIAKGKASMTDPIMADFVARIDEINALAETHEGFIWRLKDDSGHAMNIRPFADPTLLVNLSVWENLEALKDYTFHTAHAELMRDRKKWFDKMESAHLVLWWIPVGTTPTLEEAKKRLNYLKTHGPTHYAFNFKHFFEVAQE